ncbi:tRNA pseudouridine(55) synthase TruB [Dokdonella sp.]|uniref:tRNA pseudouridine(55) synthase TruB n=1 Tax=Dokdonella sp. TaxID=2291710 RepID=UPI001B232D6A|nr:tRNA pseudouridine(55) synthase TruB [Dokdonella sp.]MBO9662499.1 tRNA pseudouridine(55) synthase TruB [Dokdonella sp.]
MPVDESVPNRKISWRDLHGILLLDKPQGLSSNAALQKVRRLLRAEKGGHTGSLDPLATGLLPLCFGEATKIAGLLLGSRKAYETEARLGLTTTTDDAEGEVVERREVPVLDDAAIRAALAGLTGRIVQVPPVYSALKQGGEPLYRRARRGEDVAAAPREVEVHRFELHDRAGDRLRLRVECGSGTYVRSLVRDLGERLGCGAHVTVLRRTWVEPFLAPRMHTLDELNRLAEADPAALDALLLPLEEGLAGYPQARLDEAQATRLRQGQAIDWPGPPGRCVALDPNGRAVALAEVAAGQLRPLRGFNASAAVS